MNILVGGGSGFLGRALITKLVKNGCNVRIITRNPKTSNDISWKDIQSSGIPNGTDAVLNLSGRSIAEMNPLLCFPGKMKSYLDDVYNSRILTSRMLAEACTSTKSVRFFINASGVGFYKPDLELVQTESLPYHDYNFFTRLCRDWEAAASSFQRADINYFFLRFGIVLGMHSPFLNQLFLSHKLGLGGPIGSGQQWISWIYINDAVDLITFILNPDTKLPNGPINVCSPNPVRQSTFSVSLSEAVGAPFSGRFRVPALLVYLMLGKDRASMALEGHRAFPTKALAAGFHFRYPLIEDALEAVYGRRPRSVSTT